MLSGEGLSKSEILHETSSVPGTPGYYVTQVRFHSTGVIFTSPWQPNEASFAAETGWCVLLNFKYFECY